MASKMDQVIEVILGALKEIAEREGQEGYRHEYDKGLHIYSAIKDKFDIHMKANRVKKGGE